MLLNLLIISVFFLAWANGANDNFKGVTTLYGSGTTTFRKALVWATGATVAGSLVSVALAAKLISAFQGKGLVPKELLGPQLLAAVAAAGAITILLATILRMPTSTPHALTGALVGTGEGRPSSRVYCLTNTPRSGPLILPGLTAQKDVC